MKRVIVFAALVAVLAFGSAAVADVMEIVNYQGYLTDASGYPVTGTVDMTFNLWDNIIGGAVVWTETWNAGTSQIIVTDGYYSVWLGNFTAFGSLFRDYPQLWLEVSVNGENLSPMKLLTSSAYSMEALNADTLDNLDSADFYQKTDSVDADTLDGQDSTAFAGASHSHSFSEITGSVTDAQVPDDITIDYAAAAGSVPWSGITGIPLGFSDGVDNEGVTTEVDPTVPANIKDGVDFSELSGTATDAQIPDDITIDNANAAGSVPWSGITGMPSGFSDNIDNEGVTTEVDPTVQANVKDGVDFSELSGTATDAQIPDDITIDYATAAGSVPWSGVTSMPAGFADNTDDTGLLCTPITSVPTTISSPGYYCLTGNLTGTGSDMITITANNVTLDLKGFTMTGTATTSEEGIYINGTSNVEVRNGTVENCGREGVHSYGTTGLRIFNMRLMNNGQAGSYDGVFLSSGYNSMVKNCTAAGNTYAGFYCSYSTILKGNTSYNNTRQGMYGGNGSVLTDNVAHENGEDGIRAGSGSKMFNNTAYSNGHQGIECNTGCTVSGNTSYDNLYDGFYVGYGGTVIGNTSYSNDEDGFYLSGRATVKNNTSYGNQYNGFNCNAGNCLIDGNTGASNNGASGSYANFATCATCTIGLNHDGP